MTPAPYETLKGSRIHRPGEEDLNSLAHSKVCSLIVDREIERIDPNWVQRGHVVEVVGSH